MFVGFDLEEVGLFGSRYFVEHSPVPLDRIALFVTADMIGRSLGGVCDVVRLRDGDRARPRPPALDRACRRGTARQGRPARQRPAVLDRSDYGPFRARKVPYLFFSTGENPLYHTPRRHRRDARLPQARRRSAA